MSSSPGIAASGFPPQAFFLPTPQVVAALPQGAVPSPTGNSTSVPTLPSFADIVSSLTQSDLTHRNLAQPNGSNPVPTDGTPVRVPRKTDAAMTGIAVTGLATSRPSIPARISLPAEEVTASLVPWKNWPSPQSGAEHDVRTEDGLTQVAHDPPQPATIALYAQRPPTQVPMTEIAALELASSQPPVPARIPLRAKELPGSLVALKNWPMPHPVAQRADREEDDLTLIVPGPPQPVPLALDVPRRPVSNLVGDHHLTGDGASAGINRDIRDIEVDLPDAPREVLPLTPDDTVFKIRLRLGSPETAASFIEPAAQKPSSPIEPGSAAAQPEPSSKPPVPGSKTAEQIHHPANPNGTPQERNNSERNDRPDSDSDNRKPVTRPDNSGKNRITGPLAVAIEAKPLPVAAHAVPATQALPAGAVLSAEPPRSPAPPLAPPETAAPARAQEPDVPQPQPQPQVRSMALEFTPDGGRDVRLRVVERGGEVHVSVHSTDTGLTGRLQDGVQDLAGALAGAGYDAEAWTPRDEQRRHQPEPPPELPPAKAQPAAPGEEFAGLFNNPRQETR